MFFVFCFLFVDRVFSASTCVWRSIKGERVYTSVVALNSTRERKPTLACKMSSIDVDSFRLVVVVVVDAKCVRACASAISGDRTKRQQTALAAFAAQICNARAIISAGQRVRARATAAAATSSGGDKQRRRRQAKTRVSRLVIGRVPFEARARAQVLTSDRANACRAVLRCGG